MSTRRALLLPVLLSTFVAGCVDLDAVDPDGVDPDGVDSEAEPDNIGLCRTVTSTEQEFAPVQITGAGTPAEALGRSWVRPTEWTRIAAFTGRSGQPAAHEGDDYVHDDRSVTDVPVLASGAGTVAYVRKGCPQSSMFAHNTQLRECGSGWGNHVVVHHGGDLYTRYGHIAPGSITVEVGDSVSAGRRLGWMGNSGRSEVRHLHFELGTKRSGFDSCALSQSFDRVFAPGRLPFGAAPSSDYGRIECPAGYAFKSFNDAGGGLCVDRNGNAYGPFTRGMVENCLGWGGGDACHTNRWSESLARSTYGAGTCPAGAAKDGPTGYCLEDDDGFGPFPSDMIAECIARDGGEVACRSARWNADFMRRIYSLTR